MLSPRSFTCTARRRAGGQDGGFWSAARCACGGGGGTKRQVWQTRAHGLALLARPCAVVCNTREAQHGARSCVIRIGAPPTASSTRPCLLYSRCSGVTSMHFQGPLSAGGARNRWLQAPCRVRSMERPQPGTPPLQRLLCAWRLRECSRGAIMALPLNTRMLRRLQHLYDIHAIGKPGHKAGRRGARGRGRPRRTSRRQRRGRYTPQATARRRRRRTRPPRAGPASASRAPPLRTRRWPAATRPSSRAFPLALQVIARVFATPFVRVGGKEGRDACGCWGSLLLRQVDRWRDSLSSSHDNGGHLVVISDQNELRCV